MNFAQRAIGSILHHQKRNTIFHIKVEDAHNMGMREMGQHACLSAELLATLTGEVGMQHFDGCLSVEVQVFSQIDLSKARSPDETGQAIVAKLLSYAVDHAHTSSGYLTLHSLMCPGWARECLSLRRTLTPSSEFCDILYSTEGRTSIARILFLCYVLPELRRGGRAVNDYLGARYTAPLSSTFSTLLDVTKRVLVVFFVPGRGIRRSTVVPCCAFE